MKSNHVKPISLYQELPLADKSMCMISLSGYLFIVFSGCNHLNNKSKHGYFDQNKIKNDYVITSSLYLFESLIAFLTNKTTLRGWSKFHYLSHHIAMSVLLFIPATLNPEVMKPFEKTLICGLFLNLGELIAALKSFGLNMNKSMKFIFYAYMIMFLGLQIISESYDGLNVLKKCIGNDNDENIQNKNLKIYIALLSFTFCPYYHLLSPFKWYCTTFMRLIKSD